MPYCPECSASVPEGAEDCPTCGAGLVDTPTTGDDEAGAPSMDVQLLHRQLSVALAPRYEILKLLGSGGMGAVFLAREPALKRLVAVKALSPSLAADPPARARFQREARSAASLSHPNIVRVYAVGQTRGKIPYIVMQYVEGATLTDWMKKKRRLPERDVRRIVGEVAAALASAHARDLVHRDVKPGNVLIEADSGRAFVADFGVSAALSPAGMQETKLTATGAIIGTPPYMSPEQAAGDPLTPKSDVYSLGVMAYELLTGALPFTATTTLGWATAHLRDTPEPITRKRSELAPHLAKLVQRCLAKAPKERPTASEVARALLPSLETEIRWPPPGLDGLLGRAHLLNRVLLITAAAGLMVLLAMAFTPDILEVHERWLSRFTVDPVAGGLAARARSVGQDPSQVSFFLWESALILGSAVFVVGLLYLAAVIQWLRRILRYRALGWSWKTLAQVAADHDGRSGALLAGGGEFGFLQNKERWQILRSRALMAGWVLAAELWVITVLGLWIIGAAIGLLGGASPSSLAGTTGLLVALIPAGVLLGVAEYHSLTERRLLGSLSVSVRRPARVTELEVEEWYRTAPGDLAGGPDPRTYPRGPRIHLAAVTTAIGLAALLAIGLAQIVLASAAAARFVQSVGPRAAELSATANLLAAQDPYTEMRRLLAPYMPLQAVRPDTTVRRLVRQLLDLDLREPLPPHPWVELDRLGPPPQDAALQHAVRLAYERNLPADVLVVLEQIASHPRVQAFHQLAHATKVDFVGALLDRPMSSYFTPGAIRPATMGGLLQAARLNSLAAIAELQVGSMERAVEQFGEAAAVAEHLLRSPLMAAGAYSILRWDVLPPLAALAEVQGRAEEARALASARDRLIAVRQNLPRAGIAGLAAEAPNMPQFARLVTQGPLPLGERVELLLDGWAGLCANPAEVITGPSAAREKRLLEIADSVGFEYARDLVLLARRPWVRSSNAPAILDWGPGGMTLRLLSCTWMERLAR